VGGLRHSGVQAHQRRQFAPQLAVNNANRQINSVYALTAFPSTTKMTRPDLTGRSDWSSTLPRRYLRSLPVRQRGCIVERELPPPRARVSFAEARLGAGGQRLLFAQSTQHYNLAVNAIRQTREYLFPGSSSVLILPSSLCTNARTTSPFAVLRPRVVP
jgi:hypothetical protein